MQIFLRLNPSSLNSHLSSTPNYHSFLIFAHTKRETMSTVTASDSKKEMATDFLPLEGTDYVEFYVGNAKQAAHYYMSAFGFQAIAYSGPETGVKDRASYVVRQNKLTFVLTTPIRGENPIADHIYKHGDGVKSLSLRVGDATKAWEETTKRGAKSYMQPVRL